MKTQTLGCILAADSRGVTEDEHLSYCEPTNRSKGQVRTRLGSHRIVKCNKDRVKRAMPHHKMEAVRCQTNLKAVKSHLAILAPKRINLEFTVNASECGWMTDIY